MMANSDVSSHRRAVLIGNVSGSTGDRLDALKSMLRGRTKVDAITGDWLSEFNLASRSLQLSGNPDGGYEPGFLLSLRIAIDEYLEYPNPKLKIVVNAGGLNPEALANKVQEFLVAKKITKKIAYITGDNLLTSINDLEVRPLTEATGDFASWKTKYPEILLANAYIGCWGIVKALDGGADIVICGRCTDASPTMGIAAWWHKWSADSFHELAGALAGGHLIECGPYVCGGNYGGFHEMPNHYDLSFPIAEIAADGTSIVQKQPDQNGIMSTDTTKGQFLYELQGRFYYNPDVIADMWNIQMEQIGQDKVRVWGAEGLAAPATLKLAVMSKAGYQAEFSVYMTGLDLMEKARSFELMSRRIVDESKFQTLQFQMYGSEKEDPTTQTEATLHIRVFAQAENRESLSAGKFLGPMLSNQLQGYPGLTPNHDFRTAAPKLYCTYFPGLVKQDASRQRVHLLASDSNEILEVPGPYVMTSIEELPKQQDMGPSNPVPMQDFGETVRHPLGRLVYSRSGDKGANVNVGFFIPSVRSSSRSWDWLRSFLTTEKLRVLLGTEVTADTHIERDEFKGIQAVHFVIHGHLGAGVSSASKIDALGKNVAEFLRARWVDIPKELLLHSNDHRL